MLKLYLDIETLPGLFPPQLSEIKVPGNIKKPESIAKWKEDNLESVWRKEAVQPEKGRIWFLCCAVEDADPVTHTNMKGFMKYVLKLKQQHMQVTFVAHNMRFDRSFLFAHFIREQQMDYARIIAGKEGDLFHCTMEMFMPFEYKYRISLDKALKSTGLESHKSKIDGSMIFDLWKEERFEEAEAYCKDDVRAVRQLYKKLDIS